MMPNGYSVIVDIDNRFILRYHADVNRPTEYYFVCASYHWDDIMRELIKHRVSYGMEKEYWI